jgi:hypothetical protein
LNTARLSVSSRRTLVLLLLCCLLAAQWLGLGHGIAHAGWNAAGQFVEETTLFGSKTGDIDLRHSCAAFDEATLPALLTTPPYRAPLLPAASVLSLWTAFLSWQQPYSCHFQSRAPPVS